MYRFSKGYGSLICGQPPFNVMVIPFLPLFLFMDGNPKTKKCNDILLHVLYFPIAAACCAIFFALNLVLLPFGYIWSIIFKFNIMISDLQKSYFECILEIIFFMIVGGPFLFISMFRDFYFFVLQL